jgi:hypothetical protein
MVTVYDSDPTSQHGTNKVGLDQELPDHFTCLNCLTLCIGFLLLACRQVTQVWLHMWLARLIDPLVGRYTHPWTFTPLIVAVTTLWLCYNLMIGLTLFQELVMIWFHR